jgi:hypothetical protein
MSLTAEPVRPATGAPRLLSRIMQLLAGEAPTAELDVALARAARAGVPPRALADVRRIRALLDHRAQREREAQVLYETARDLTSLRGVDAVLTAIVDRARRLLASDSAYIALLDQGSGDAVMRVTSGTRTDAIRWVRQRPGYGVGGHVIATGRPLATADYRTDPRIRRDPDVATAVEQDGIVSIAAVPIKRGSVVVGALFAANRRERTFQQAEIAMLTSLAAHAAIVLENARLFERVQESSTQLREANARLRAQREALERAGRAHEQLMPMALTRVGMSEFTRTLARILGGRVTVVGRAGDVLAEAGVPGAGAAAGPTRRVPVRAGAETFGHLVVTARAGTVPDTGADARTLERAAQTAALLLLMQQRTSMVEQELRAELVEDLLAEQAPDWQAFGRRADRLGVTGLDGPHSVVVLAAEAVPRRVLLTAAAGFAARRGGITGEHAGQPVLLMPGEDAGAVARAAAGEIGAGTGRPVTAGAAGPAASPQALRALHVAAARCNRLLRALGRDGEGATIADLGVLGCLVENASPGHLRHLVERAIGPVLRYDREHGAQLVETARGFFAAGQNAPAAARVLGVHVNTVYQRLDRIDQVLGTACWRSPAGAMEVQMALQLHEQSRSPRPLLPDPQLR